MLCSSGGQVELLGAASVGRRLAGGRPRAAQAAAESATSSSAATITIGEAAAKMKEEMRAQGNIQMLHKWLSDDTDDSTRAAVPTQPSRRARPAVLQTVLTGLIHCS